MSFSYWIGMCCILVTQFYLWWLCKVLWLWILRRRTSYPTIFSLKSPILEDFRVHHQLWLSTSSADKPGEQSYFFSLFNDLVQLAQHPTIIADHLGDTLNTRHLFLAFKPSSYFVKLPSPLRSFDHSFISVSRPIISIQPQNPRGSDTSNIIVYLCGTTLHSNFHFSFWLIVAPK